MIDIDNLTLGQIKELQKLLGAAPSAAEFTTYNPGTKVIIRARDAGCHFGEFVAQPSERVVVLKNSRRLWKFVGAETLSDLAMYGAKKPDECRFAAKITGNHSILDACEIITCSAVGAKMIEGCAEWKA